MNAQATHEQIRTEERVAKARHRGLMKAQRVQARQREQAAQREAAATERHARRQEAAVERAYQASLAEDHARQLSIVYPDAELAESALGPWTRRHIAAAVEHVRTRGGREGYAVMEV